MRPARIDGAATDATALDRLLSIQALRAVAALLVVFYHLRTAELKYLESPAVLDSVARYASVGVDLFFVISGFVMTTLAAGRYQKPGASSRFLIQRAWRIVPLYWCFTTVVVILMAIVPTLINSGYEGQSYLLSYLFIPHEQMPLLSVGWTLEHEVYFYLTFATLLAFVPERKVPLTLASWAAIVVAVGTAVGPDASPVLQLSTSPLTLEFIAGAFLGVYWQRIPPFLAGVLVLCGTSAFLLAPSHLLFDGPESMSNWERAALFGIPSLLVVAGLVRIEATGRLRLPRWLTRLGDASYALYLSHMFIITATGRAWAWFAPTTGPTSHVAFVIISVLACCLVGALVHQWIERPLMTLPARIGVRHTGRSAARQRPSGLG